MGESVPENWNGEIQVLCRKFKYIFFNNNNNKNLEDAEIWGSHQPLNQFAQSRADHLGQSYLVLLL